MAYMLSFTNNFIIYYRKVIRHIKNKNKMFNAYFNDNDLPTEFPLSAARNNKKGSFFSVLINLTQRIRDQSHWSLIQESCEKRIPKKIWTDGQHIIMYVPSHPETCEDTFVLLQRTPEESWMTIEYASHTVQESHQNPDIFAGIEDIYGRI